MEIIIARHGETNYNIKGLIQGQRQSKLSENGIRQAKALAKSLKKEKIEFIYTSELIRAVETAKIINKFHNLKINKTEELNERNFGVFEGRKGDLIQKEFRRNVMEDINFKPKGAETWRDINKRVISFMRSIIKKHKGKNVLIVAHKGVNSLILTYFLKNPLKDHWKVKQSPANISRIKIENGKTDVKVNDVKHLNGLKIIKEKMLF